MKNINPGNDILSTLRDKYKFKIENACFAVGAIPKLILLDRTRNIHSYIILCNKTGDNLISKDFLHGDDLEKNLVEITKIQFSSLDRPLFLLFENKILKNIDVIEVSEVKELFLRGEFSIKKLFELTMSFDQVSTFIKQEL
jgi:hypothetical protein